MNQLAKVRTLITYHPSRPEKCLLRAVETASMATELLHVIDLRVQGQTDERLAKRVRSISEVPVEVFFYGENTGQVRPLIDATERFLETDALWFGKLDDDGSLPERAWDHLIEAIIACPLLIGCAMAAPKGTRADPEAILPPRLLKNQGKVWKTVPGSLGEGRSRGSQWSVCEVVGDGCSIFPREVFELGCWWDSRFEMSADVDMMVQLHKLGYLVLKTNPPTAGHHHKECANENYDSQRYDPGKAQRTADAFIDKWGHDLKELRRFK